MEYKNLITNHVRSWNFTRSETLEILHSLDDKKLQFKPEGNTWQPLFWEFGCIGRTQMVYSNAILTGKMDFSFFDSDKLPTKTTNQTVKDIEKFLEKTNTEWLELIRSKRRDEDFKVKWPGNNMPLTVHIASLANHERLHHGQFISYFTLAGFDLPKNFKTNWAL